MFFILSEFSQKNHFQILSSLMSGRPISEIIEPAIKKVNAEPTEMKPEGVKGQSRSLVNKGI